MIEPLFKRALKPDACRVEVTSVSWIDSDALLQEASPDFARTVSFETAMPIRVPAAYKGQRHLSGYFWSAKAGRSLLFESRLEMHNLLRLEHDPDVVSISTQPFRVRYKANGRVRSSVPDIFCRLADGTGTVDECKPHGQQGRPKVAAKLAETKHAVEALGLEYRVVGELPTALAANLRWLGGFRKPMRDADGVADRMLELLADGPVPLRDLFATGEPCHARPIAFGLLWSRRANADLNQPLSSNTLVTIGENQ